MCDVLSAAAAATLIAGTAVGAGCATTNDGFVDFASVRNDPDALLALIMNSEPAAERADDTPDAFARTAERARATGYAMAASSSAPAPAVRSDGLPGSLGLAWRSISDNPYDVTRPIADGDPLIAGASAVRAPTLADIGAPGEPAVYDAGLRLDYALPVANTVAGDFELDVAPRASMVVGDDVNGAAAGALVRLGRDLGAPRTGSDAQGWYMFAGADAQAVTWKPSQGVVDAGSNMRVEDMEFVGDAQAGLGRRIGGGDLAVGFVHREFKAKGATADEQFGGVTFVVKR